MSAVDPAAVDPRAPDPSLPTLTAMGLVTRDDIHPGGVAVCRLIGEHVFPLLAELFPDEMPHHEAFTYAAHLQTSLRVWNVVADVTSAGRDAREDIRRAFGYPNVDLVAVSERVTDADADVRIKRPLREVTSRLDWLLDHGLYVRLGRDHPAEVALQTYEARRRRPDADEQKFVRDEADSYVIPIAGACSALNVDRLPEVSIPRGRIGHRSWERARTPRPPADQPMVRRADPAELDRRAELEEQEQEALRQAGAEAQRQAVSRRAARPARAAGYQPTALDGIHPDIPNETEE